MKKSENDLIFEAYLNENIERFKLSRNDFNEPDVEARDEEVPTYCAECGRHMSGPDLGPMKQAMEKYDNISHGLCEECEEIQMQKIEQMYGK